MKLSCIHSWDVSPRQAREIQIQLKERIDTSSSVDMSRIRKIAAADISFNKYEKFLYAAVTFHSFPALEFQFMKSLKIQTGFPYIPGYLSFREAPAVVEIFRQLDTRPDVLLCDGQGIAHPRGIGLASHLGLILDVPAIGCAKSVLVGEYEDPPPEKGGLTPLIYHGEQVGAALRTRDHVKPVFVSPGHRITLDDACKIVLKCSPRFRLPEPLRKAHEIVNTLRKNDINSG